MSLCGGGLGKERKGGRDDKEVSPMNIDIKYAEKSEANIEVSRRGDAQL